MTLLWIPLIIFGFLLVWSFVTTATLDKDISDLDAKRERQYFTFMKEQQDRKRLIKSLRQRIHKLERKVSVAKCSCFDSSVPPPGRTYTYANDTDGDITTMPGSTTFTGQGLQDGYITFDTPEYAN